MLNILPMGLTCSLRTLAIVALLAGQHAARAAEGDDPAGSQPPTRPAQQSPPAGSSKATEATSPEATAATTPAPTLADVAYGEHERHRLDFWQAPSRSELSQSTKNKPARTTLRPDAERTAPAADSARPTPLVFVIHGGGWQNGTKERVSRFVDIPRLLESGISVVAINYRLISHALEESVEPPVKAPLHDAARALQYVRSRAGEWNIDKTRIAATGGSAGACSSLWLAFHDDLADADSDDPIARESTRLCYAAVNGAQTTLDPQQMKEWTPNSRYGAHAFGITAPKGTSAFETFLQERERLLPWIAEYSPYALLTSDDPPVTLYYSAPPAIGEEQKDPTHTANFGVMLQRKCTDVGVSCELVHPGQTTIERATVTDAMIHNLTAVSR